MILFLLFSQWVFIEALVNLGLENRAIAPTLMNTTSSRSHTILTINIEQKTSYSPTSLRSKRGMKKKTNPSKKSHSKKASKGGSKMRNNSHDVDDEDDVILIEIDENSDDNEDFEDPSDFLDDGEDGEDGMYSGASSWGPAITTVRSKLLMVDLAGSERVRRTISQGNRLSEAKAINTSLSALGNVIAALAEGANNSNDNGNNGTLTNGGGNASVNVHIPYRDSKLTRLLQDSLGGTASTALLATVGPAPVNYGETLSTLLFATRCMNVKTRPLRHEEVDYAQLCARLQEKLATVEGEFSTKILEQQQKYESIIQRLNNQVSYF